MLDAVFFDFDGVIVESADIKTDAFYELFLPYGIEFAEKVKEYHLVNQGVSRFEKFQHIYRSYLGQDYTPAIGEDFSEKFSAIVLAKIFSCPMVEGVLEFLEVLNQNQVKCFLLSATPQQELEEICSKRNLTHYFQGIYGAPFAKSDAGNMIINEYGLRREQIVFIGDSSSDMIASKELSVTFIGRIAKIDTDPFPENVYKISNFKDAGLLNLIHG